MQLMAPNIIATTPQTLPHFCKGMLRRHNAEHRLTPLLLLFDVWAIYRPCTGRMGNWIKLDNARITLFTMLLSSFGGAHPRLSQ